MRSKIPVTSSRKWPLFACDMRNMVQHNETLFKIKEVNAQFAESGSLWVCASFSENFTIKNRERFLANEKTKDYSRIFSSANDFQCMVTNLSLSVLI